MAFTHAGWVENRWGKKRLVNLRETKSFWISEFYERFRKSNGVRTGDDLGVLVQLDLESIYKLEQS